MPFGLGMSMNVFQVKMDQRVEKGNSVLWIHDDLGIYSCSEKEYDTNLFNLKWIVSNNCLIFNKRKCQTKHP